MKKILFTLIAACFTSQAQAEWKNGAEAVFEIHSNQGAADSFTALPVFGLDSVPLLALPSSIRQSEDILRALSGGVDREEELVRLLKLTERDFADRAGHYLGGLQKGVSPIGSGTESQKRAWGVINRNQQEGITLRLKLRTFYRVRDFEISSSIGEGSERRLSCAAGFHQRVELEVVGVAVAGKPELNWAAQGVKGTVFKGDHAYFVGRTFLDMRIDLGPEEGKAFARECRAVKDTLR